MPVWITFAILAVQLIPLVKEVVTEIESLFGGQPGAFKKEQAVAFLRVLLQGTAGLSKLDQQTIDAIMAILGFLIDLIVSGFNSKGVFVHKSTT